MDEICKTKLFINWTTHSTGRWFPRDRKQIRRRTKEARKVRICKWISEERELHRKQEQKELQRKRSRELQRVPLWTDKWINGRKLPKAEERTNGWKQTELPLKLTEGQEEFIFLNNKEKKILSIKKSMF